LLAGASGLAQAAAGDGLETAGEALAGIRAGDREHIARMEGMADGLAAANSFLTLKGQQPLFCRQRGSTTQEDVDILAAYVRKYPNQATTPTVIALTYAMVERFPCN